METSSSLAQIKRSLPLTIQSKEKVVVLLTIRIFYYPITLGIV